MATVTDKRDFIQMLNDDNSEFDWFDGAEPSYLERLQALLSEVRPSTQRWARVKGDIQRQSRILEDLAPEQARASQTAIERLRDGDLVVAQAELSGILRAIGEMLAQDSPDGRLHRLDPQVWLAIPASHRARLGKFCGSRGCNDVVSAIAKAELAEAEAKEQLLKQRLKE